MKTKTVESRNYSKLDSNERKNLIRKYTTQLKKIEKIEKEQAEFNNNFNKMKAKICDKWDIIDRIKLLKHIYSIGSYVVIKDTVGIKDPKVIYRICEVLEHKRVKDYIVKDTSIGMKNCFVREKINEKHILCGIESIHSISEMKFYKEGWKGKIGDEK